MGPKGINGTKGEKGDDGTKVSYLFGSHKIYIKLRLKLGYG